MSVGPRTVLVTTCVVFSLAISPLTAVAAQPTAVPILRVTGANGKALSAATVTIVETPGEAQVRAMRIGESRNAKTVLSVKTNNAGQVLAARVPVVSGRDYEVLVNADGYIQQQRYLPAAKLRTTNQRTLSDLPVVKMAQAVSALREMTTRVAPTYGPVRYTKLAERAAPVTVGQLRSATKKAKQVWCSLLMDRPRLEWA